MQGRYELDESSVPPRIRAVQGHSVHLAAPQLAPVGSADEVPLALHITSLEGWKAIQVRTRTWSAPACGQAPPAGHLQPAAHPHQHLPSGLSPSER